MKHLFGFNTSTAAFLQLQNKTNKNRWEALAHCASCLKWNTWSWWLWILVINI